MNLLTNQFFYTTGCFYADASSLNGFNAPAEITLTNPKTGNSRTFAGMVQRRDWSGEELYGWGYTCTTDPSLMLVVEND